VAAIGIRCSFVSLAVMGCIELGVPYECGFSDGCLSWLRNSLYVHLPLALSQCIVQPGLLLSQDMFS
jgi:hypothetical protein